LADVIVFHHAQGLTPGVLAFAGRLREAGHAVHAPDLYAGRTFASVEEGVAHAGEIGFDQVLERGVRAAGDVPGGLVTIGFSLGVMPAQKLAQTRPGVRGAVLCHACLPVEEFGEAWPAEVPVHIHGMEADPFFVDEGDLDAARALVTAPPKGELFLYPGNRHLFADPSLDSYDADAAALMSERILAFLAGIDTQGAPRE
jgi:dienelactone hydrolase